MSINIVPFENKYLKEVIDLATGVYGTDNSSGFLLSNQVDLLNINGCYKTGKGNFWCAFSGDEELIGIIGLADIGQESGVVRKMFVKEEWRGGFFYVAEKLLNNLEIWACSVNIDCLYVAVNDKSSIIFQFYNSRGFGEVNPDTLPHFFPRHKDDNCFLIKKLFTHVKGVERPYYIL